jgi:Fe-S cluster biosynthesis and repair protein YggX
VFSLHGKYITRTLQCNRKEIGCRSYCFYILTDLGDFNMPQMVFCQKLKRELPGLDRPPFPGPLGQRIYENISKQAFDMWPAQQVLIINHYGLNMADPESRTILRDQMEDFFFGSDPNMPEGWAPETAGAGSGPQRKGGGGAPRKK